MGVESSLNLRSDAKIDQMGNNSPPNSPYDLRGRIHRAIVYHIGRHDHQCSRHDSPFSLTGLWTN